MRLALRFALRELAGGLGGLRLLAICLVIGVAALAGIGSLAAAIEGGIQSGGREILGGDVELRVSQRTATPDELADLRRLGPLSDTVRMRAMAQRIDGGGGTLVELKGVDAAYPLYGRLRLAPGALKPRPGRGEAAVAPALLDRLSLRVGDRITVGQATLTIVGSIASEPDRVGEGFTLGPPLLVDRATLSDTGLVQPGSLYQTKLRLRLPPGVDPRPVAARLEHRLAGAGWDARNRTNAAPGVTRFITSLGQFLSLVGLAALAVAGIGVGNGVGSYLDGKRQGIAVMKALGASGGTIFATYLLQVVIVAAAGIALGLCLGALVPALVDAIAGDALPVRPGFSLHAAPLALAAGYGLLVALLFSLGPLARARAVTAASLLRGGVEALPPARWTVRAGQGAVAVAVALLAILSADQPRVAAIFLAAVVGLLGLLVLLGWGIRRAAARLPHPRSPLARLALANLHRPGAPTARLVVALGLGLTLFVTFAAVQTSLGHAIRATIPAQAPSFFALDLPKDEVGRFRALVQGQAPGARIATVPMLRGAVVEVAGRRVADMKTIPEGAWILRGDRGLTYAADLPPSNRVVAGRWWPRDYAGPPLVSIDVAAARALGLKVGDSLTVSVLGVEVPARIASFREIDWSTMGFNFAILFAPGALEGAPHSWSATVNAPEARSGAIARAVSRALPAVTLIPVADVIGQVSTLLGQMALAVSAAAGVALLAGVAVLVGAVTASRRARAYDSVLLKLLGATRGQVLATQAMELALLAAAVLAVALAIGLAGAWYLVTQVLHLAWAPDPLVVGATLLAGAATVLLLGLAAGWPALSARPAQALRDL